MINKKGEKYVAIDPWKIIEDSFNKENCRILESIFTVSNGIIGTRGYFDETFSGETNIGTYIAGVYEEISEKPTYKGIPTRTQFIVNNANWLWTKIFADGEELDLNNSYIEDYIRYLDLKEGVLYRNFTWRTTKGERLRISFERFVSMTIPNLCCQKIKINSIDFKGKVKIITGVDFSHKHKIYNQNYWICNQKEFINGVGKIVCETMNTKKTTEVMFNTKIINYCKKETFESEKTLAETYELEVNREKTIELEKIVAFNVNAVFDTDTHLAKFQEIITNYNYEGLKKQQINFWADIWKRVDIEIGNDEENQQGIRFCVFQMLQAYSGAEGISYGIGAKGLSGEVYNGNAFWDSEVYCLPFYLFTNLQAAKKLLDFRYQTLSEAIERAKELDLDGAFYPIATIDGSESCTLWQHANLQLQASTGVAYGIWHYWINTDDQEFLFSKGVDMLIQICKMLASRVQIGQKDNKYGYFGVMGPDEFHMMVNNDFYTNYMAKKTFEFTLFTLDLIEKHNIEIYKQVLEKNCLHEEEICEWKNISENINILQDLDSKIYEQHEGYFNLPHLEISKIPQEEIPLYKHWSYDRIYRYDMIKQPAVLLAMFLYNNKFTLEEKQVNYNYYDKRCMHESSLSPSIHSILACELGLYKKAYEYFMYATRLDLDNYNKNTDEGLHITSLAAAWLNIVYGFGGMRSDEDILMFSPMIPDNWSYYSFKVVYKGAIISVYVDKEKVKFQTLNGKEITLKIYNNKFTINSEPLILPLKRQAGKCE